MLSWNDYVKGLPQQKPPSASPPIIRSLLENLIQHRPSTQESQTDAKHIRGTKCTKLKNLFKFRIKRQINRQSDLLKKCCSRCSRREMTDLCREVYG